MDKTLILCADDFGQNKSISDGILELAQRSRLSAVSCMVNGASWPYGIDDLKSCDVELGLHLNLTHGASFSAFWGQRFPSLFKLLLNLYRLDQDALYHEILAQIEKFKADVGFYPQFIDGHQHVHQLPIVRDALFKALDQLPNRPWLRSTYTSDNQRLSHFINWKRWILYFLGGRAFQRLLQQKGYRTNKDFSGDYTFSEDINYPKRFRRFLAELPHLGLIMCHPGKVSVDSTDSIASIRPLEFQYFQSEAFLKDLKETGVELGKLD
ncbi:MAG: hypothetical protein QG556_1037 [Pseudomonadota bacterium]|nr:hypothetical protein [Pseudomonadota bacterium]